MVLGVSLFVGFHARRHASSERERSFVHNEKAGHACYLFFQPPPQGTGVLRRNILYIVSYKKFVDFGLAYG